MANSSMESVCRLPDKEILYKYHYTTGSKILLEAKCMLFKSFHTSI